MGYAIVFLVGITIGMICMALCAVQKYDKFYEGDTNENNNNIS